MGQPIPGRFNSGAARFVGSRVPLGGTLLLTASGRYPSRRGRMPLTVVHSKDEGRNTYHDDGTKLSVAGLCVFVTIAGGTKALDDFRRFCRKNNVNAAPHAEGYGERDGTFYETPDATRGAAGRSVRRKDESTGAVVFKCIGKTGADMNAIANHYAVVSAEKNDSGRVGVIAGGNGVASAAAERRIREGRKEGIARAEDRSIADTRPYRPVDAETAQLRAVATALDIDAGNADMPMLAEMIRLQSNVADASDAELHRLASLMAHFGVS